VWQNQGETDSLVEKRANPKPEKEEEKECSTLNAKEKVSGAMGVLGASLRRREYVLGPVESRGLYAGAS